jgi:uncharacterized membrane protein YkvA (DUF1232 family)
MWKRLTLLWVLLRGDARQLWFALRHPAAPGWLKLGTALIALYVLSPIDLIPDVLPVIGVVDELVLVPLAIRWLLKRLPPNIAQAASTRRYAGASGGRRLRRAGDPRAVVSSGWRACRRKPSRAVTGGVAYTAQMSAGGSRSSPAPGAGARCAGTWRCPTGAGEDAVAIQRPRHRDVAVVPAEEPVDLHRLACRPELSATTRRHGAG